YIFIFFVLLVPPRSTLFPYTTLFRSHGAEEHDALEGDVHDAGALAEQAAERREQERRGGADHRREQREEHDGVHAATPPPPPAGRAAAPPRPRRCRAGRHG